MLEKTDPFVYEIQKMVSSALQIPIAETNPELAFGDLPQWDSMGHMEIMLLLEENFGVEVSTDTIASLTSIPAICSYLKDHPHE
jgi:acyl carrier protein